MKIRDFKIEPAEFPYKYLVTVFLKDGKKKIVKFGSQGYGDYPQYYAKINPSYAAKQKKEYIARHGAKAANEDWTDPTSAGFWSRWYLWDKPTLEEAESSIREKIVSK